MKLGLISDTHGYLDPRVEKIFAGVDHILHAGDIGPDLLIAQLEAIAPVTAVLGNNDSSPCFPLTQVVTLGGRKILVHHIVAPFALRNELRERVTHEQPHVVVFGHTHKPFNEVISSIHFLNPGYAGRPRFNQARSLAVLECGSRGIRPRFIDL